MAQYSAQFQRAKVLVLGDVMLDRYWLAQPTEFHRKRPYPLCASNKTKNVLVARQT